MTRRYYRLRCRVERAVRALWLWVQNGWQGPPPAKADAGPVTVLGGYDPEVLAAARAEARARNAAEVRARLCLDDRDRKAP